MRDGMRKFDLVHCLVYSLIMIVNMHDAKTHFSKYVSQALHGDEIIIAKNGKPLVKITPIDQKNNVRTPGLSRGKIELTEDFDSPLDPSILEEFEK